MKNFLQSGNEITESIFQWFNKEKDNKGSHLTIPTTSKDITCLAVSSDKSNVLCGSSDGIGRVFEVASGKELKNFIGHKDAITAVKFLSITTVLTGSKDGSICIWDVNSTQRLKVCEGHRRSISAIAVRSDGKQFVSTGWDTCLKLWRNDGTLEGSISQK